LKRFHISQLEVAVLRYRVDIAECPVCVDTHDSLGMRF
jgi:hypothetical protein